jgi:predicted nucleic acid-binding protein
MKLAYVDTSCVVAVAFGEPEAPRIEARLRRFDRLLASNLLEAELRSALKREGVIDTGSVLLSWLTWVYANRPLTSELDRITAEGYVKGADLWHLAHALFLSPTARELTFLTLDQRQRDVAARLGFAT